MYKTLLIALLVICSFPELTAQNQDILGYWETAEKGGIVDIYEVRPGQYAGRLVWSVKGDYEVDSKNPDPSLRNRYIVGLSFMYGFNKKKDQYYGTIYDPTSGRNYSATMWGKDDGKLALRGYIGFSLLGKTTVWTRPQKDHVYFNPK